MLQFKTNKITQERFLAVIHYFILSLYIIIIITIEQQKFYEVFLPLLSLLFPRCQGSNIRGSRSIVRKQNRPEFDSAVTIIYCRTIGLFVTEAGLELRTEKKIARFIRAYIIARCL